MRVNVEKFFEGSDVTIWHGDAHDVWKHLPERSVSAIVTSPPYFRRREYGVDGQLGQENDVSEYVGRLADLMTSWGTSVMREDGSLWLNIGDSYSKGSVRQGYDFPAKCALMVPERFALAMIERGWTVRNKIVWQKANPMPSSVPDRLNTTYEMLYHLVRQPDYYYDLAAIREEAKSTQEQWDAMRQSLHNHQFGHVNGTPLSETSFVNFDGKKNPGDVWRIGSQQFTEAHFAVFPEELVRRPIVATVPEGGVVADPFFGSGTTGAVARKYGRRCVGVELNRDYCSMAADRFQQEVLVF